MMNMLKNPRALGFLLFVASLVGMGYAMFLQHYMGLEPCPMCILQRVGLMAMGVFSLLFALINPKKLWASLVLWVGSFFEHCLGVWGGVASCVATKIPRPDGNVWARL